MVEKPHFFCYTFIIMIKYIEAIEGLPVELKLPLMKAFELFREEIAETVKRSDLEGLKAVVRDLAEAQRGSEQRLTRLEAIVEELAEAQRRTEQSLESFKKTTEENFNKVWKAIDELTEAQTRTEETLNRLIKRVDIIEERLEGVSNSVGYSLENMAYRALPHLLKKEGILVSGRLIRRYWEENQINIWGKGKKGGKDLLLLGESKVRPSKKEVDRFIKIAEEIKRKEKTETYLLFIAHDYPPAIEGYLRQKRIKYYWSYELEA